MEQDFDQQAVDAAIILENKVQERVREVASRLVLALIDERLNHTFKEQKAAMLMEITVTLSQMLRGFADDERVPLWEQTEDDKLFKTRDKDAIRKQETPI